MTRCYADPVEVLRRDEVPTQFLWRARLHVVRAVLAHWVESTAWWTGRAATALLTGAAPGSVSSAGTPALAVLADPSRDEPLTSCDPLGVHADREIWRVEAGSGRAGPVGVFDLMHLPADARWFLSRVQD